MEGKKTSKKKLVILFIVVFVIVVVAVGMVIATVRSPKIYEVIFGKWAIVYRYVDDNGNASNEFTADEFIEITDKEFTYYKGIDSDCKAVFDSKFSYIESTAQMNERLKKLNRLVSLHFELDKHTQKDLGFHFYGPDCMVFGKYGGGTRRFAVLVRCTEIGTSIDSPIIPDGTWVHPEYSSAKMTIAGSSVNGQSDRIFKENGLTKYEGEWKESSYNGEDSRKSIGTVLEVKDNYLVFINETLIKNINNMINKEATVSILFKE